MGCRYQGRRLTLRVPGCRLLDALAPSEHNLWAFLSRGFSDSDSDSQIEDLDGRVKELESDLQRRAQLVAQLEEHLAAASAATGGAAGRSAAADGGGPVAGAVGGSGGSLSLAVAAAGGSPSSRMGSMLLPQLSGSLGVIHSGDLAALSASPSAAALVEGPAAAATGGADGGGGGSLLDIVVSQRDRFRQRMVQLEEEKSEFGGRGQPRLLRREPSLTARPGPAAWCCNVTSGVAWAHPKGGSTPPRESHGRTLRGEARRREVAGER
jgi:hypothetical protein